MKDRLSSSLIACAVAALTFTDAGLTPAAVQATTPKTRTVQSIPTPAGFTRPSAGPGTFPAFLRGLPLRAPGTKVRLYNGTVKPNQTAHFAVVALSTGTRDLQQCADAIIRLRGEYLWSRGAADQMSFRYTNGTPVPWKRWRKGWRTRVEGNRVRWVKRARASRDRATFDGYLKALMMYAGTASLSRELPKLLRHQEVRVGDSLVQGGYPGHAVIVLDRAVSADGTAVVLLGQSFIPAQDFHVLANLKEPSLSPWYRVADLSTKSGLKTPEWRAFHTRDIRRF